MSDSGIHVPALPAIHALHLMEVVARWNVDPDALLDGLELRKDSLSLPELRLPIATVVRIIERARQLTGEPALGFFLGMHMKVSWHGFLGFAAMSASTVRDAIELAVRFAPTRTSALALSLEQEGDTAMLVIDERAPLGSARDAIIFALVVGIWQIGNTLTGRMLEGTADFAFAEPDYFARFRRFVPDRVRFSQPAHRLRFSAALLELPLAMADPGALELARRQCEAELDGLRQNAGIVDRIRAWLAEHGGTVGQAATAMAMSPRTLKRHLAAAGTSFIDQDTVKDLQENPVAPGAGAEVVNEVGKASLEGQASFSAGEWGELEDVEYSSQQWVPLHWARIFFDTGSADVLPNDSDTINRVINAIIKWDKKPGYEGSFFKVDIEGCHSPAWAGDDTKLEKIEEKARKGTITKKDLELEEQLLAEKNEKNRALALERAQNVRQLFARRLSMSHSRLRYGVLNGSDVAPATIGEPLDDNPYGDMEIDRSVTITVSYKIFSKNAQAANWNRDASDLLAGWHP